MMTAQDIFREIQSEGGHSFSATRRQVAMANVRFNGQQITSMTQELAVEQGSIFQVGEKHTWRRDGNKWIKLVPLESDTEYRMVLIDQAVPDGTKLDDGNSTELYCRRSGADAMLMIGALGYGEQTMEDGQGYPILVEFHEGRLRVLIWGDINEGDPTQIISLEGARENVRRQDRD